MRKIALFCCFILSLGFLYGCNTMSGAGQDIEEAGDAIEDSAERNKPY